MLLKSGSAFLRPWEKNNLSRCHMISCNIVYSITNPKMFNDMVN